MSKVKKLLVSPVLVLYNLDEIQYEMEEIEKMVMPSFKGISSKLPEKIEEVRKKFGKSTQDDTFKNISSDVTTQYFYTTNCMAFNRKTGGTCKNCLRRYENEGFGYCIKETIDTWIVKDNYNCRPSCALGYLNTMRIDKCEDRMEYEKVTIKMYSEIYPEMKIEKSNDWRLLASGSCTEKEWDISNYKYTKTIGKLILPSKEEYKRETR